MTISENRFVHVDSSKCLGCRSCEIACGLSHQELDLFHVALHGHKLEPRIVVKHSEQGPTTVQCRHCEDAPCVHVCPVNALYYQAGTVQLSQEACIGCRLCTQACPFSALQVRVKSRLEGGKEVKKAKALKCDLCISRTGAVSEEGCACIQSCPVNAMKLITEAEYQHKIC